MGLTKLAIAFALLTLGQAPNDVVYTNLRSGRIPRDINPQRLAEIRELQLFMSPDRGRTWNQVDRITPDKEAFSYSVPDDGEYWYHVVLVTQQGKQEPADLYKTPPMMKLIVDTRPPELKITSAQRQGDELTVSWSVREDNPDPPRLTLEYRPSDSNAWTSMQLTPSPQGTAKARVVTPGPVVVRLQFKDLAKNPAMIESEVQGSGAGAAYTMQTASPKLPENGPQSVPAPPSALEKTPLPLPPPPVQPSLPLPAQASTGSVVAATHLPPATAVKPVAIASTADASQGSLAPNVIGGAIRAMPELQVVNDPEVVLEYEVARVGSSGVGKVEVWITRDGGTTWARFAEDPDASQATAGAKYKRTLMLPGEGVYGISLVSKAGLGKPAPRPGEVPEMLLEVDTTPPKARLHELLPDAQHRESLILTWTAEDRNLAAAPITLEWAEQSAGPWQLIAANVHNNGQNGGRLPWRLPPNLPSHVYLKMTVRDNAGNVAVAVTPQPQLVDLSEPEGRLLRVLPANKK